MRIVQKHPHSSDTKEEKDKDDQDWETSRWVFWFCEYAAANFHCLERYQQFVLLVDSKAVVQLFLYYKIDFKQASCVLCEEKWKFWCFFHTEPPLNEQVREG